MTAGDVELGTLLALAVVVPFLAQGRAEIEPHARAVAASFLLYLPMHLRPHDVHLAIFVTALWPAVGACLAVEVLGRRSGAAVAGLFAAYAAVLVRWGGSVAMLWPWPVLAPQLAGALIAWIAWLDRKTSMPPCAVAAAMVLPASTMADVATIWAGAPDEVRAMIGTITWATFGVLLVAERRRAP